MRYKATIILSQRCVVLQNGWNFRNTCLLYGHNFWKPCCTRESNEEQRRHIQNVVQNISARWYCNITIPTQEHFPPILCQQTYTHCSNSQHPAPSSPFQLTCQLKQGNPKPQGSGHNILSSPPAISTVAWSARQLRATADAIPVSRWRLMHWKVVLSHA